MARKLIIGIFISILSIFLMSHNVSAITPVIDLNNYVVEHYTYSPNLVCSFNNAYASVDSGSYCQATINNSGFTRLDSIETDNKYPVKKDDILNFYLFVYSNTNAFESLPVLNVFTSNAHGWNVVSYQTISREDFESKIYSSNSYANQQGFNYDIHLEFENYEGFYRIYEVSLRANANNDNVRYGLYSSSGLFSFSSLDFGQRVRFYMRYFTLYRPTESKENKEVEEKTQEAVNESQDSGNNSQSSVEGSTQNLMSAGASIISALSNAPATDCNINMNTSGSSSAFTSAIGSVNLCSGVPSGVLTMVQGIVALVFTPIVLYYTYSIITTIYKQFREYNS